MTTIQIKHRYSEKVLFERGKTSGMTTRDVLEAAVAAKADLRGADLHEADLHWADLQGANLQGANLRGTDLRGANLRGANLRGANLHWANLQGADLHEADLHEADLHWADLRGTDLRGATLYGERKLIGERPFVSIGPIGSRNDYMQAWITDQGVVIHAGCFFGTRDEFLAALTQTHGSNDHAQEYLAALALIDKHAELWTPEVTE